MTINDSDTKGSTTEEVVIGSPSSSSNENVFLTPLADALGANVNKNSKELLEISEFIKKDNPKASNEDIIWGVRELLLRLGTPRFGESNLDRLYQYVFLRTEKDNIEKKLNVLGGKV